MVKKMKENEIRKRIIQCLENIGIFLDNEENMNLQNYITDSLTFLMFIVELEDIFGIDLPEDVPTYDEMISFSNLIEFIKKILGE